MFPDYLSVFYDYAYNKAYLLIWDHDEKYLPYDTNTSKNKMERSEINVHLDETYILWHPTYKFEIVFIIPLVAGVH